MIIHLYFTEDNFFFFYFQSYYYVKVKCTHKTITIQFNEIKYDKKKKNVFKYYTYILSKRMNCFPVYSRGQKIFCCQG